MAGAYPEEAFPTVTIPRQDVACPYCTIDPPFTITDVGTKIAHEGDMRRDGKVTVTVSRRPWELEMMKHLRARHTDRWAEIVAEMAAEFAQRSDPERWDPAL
jgi:hypothetical protein